MDIGTLLVIALVLVCPLTMLWMMRGHSKKTPDTHDQSGAEPGRFEPARGRAEEELERHEPPYTKSDGMVAPKFGAAGSGGGEYERGPEMHERRRQPR